MDFDFFLTPKGVETPARVLGTVAELARMRLWIRAVPWGHPKRVRSSPSTLPLALPLLSTSLSALSSSALPPQGGGAPPKIKGANCACCVSHESYEFMN